MELQLDNGEYQVVFRDSNLNVTIEESAPLNVVVGENAKIQVEQAIDYIKSGQAEIEEAVQEGIASFDSNAQEKTNTYNQNAQDKLSAYNTNAEEKLSDYNSNATSKVSAYNDNASEKLSSYNTNAQDKLDAYNLNDTAKTGAFNQNATDKTDAFNSNATAKTGDFNDNATSKTTAFNENATSKTTAFNENASEKQALVDASAQAASQSADEAKQWAIGDPSEPTGNSAKYWAEQSAGALSGLTTRVSTIEGKIPSAASSSNQLADKSYVDTADNGLQQQIDAITAASDVTDIVGTYAQLQAYDTSTLPNNSIIKVLQDESRNDETTYYRWVITAGVGAWSLIGEEGPYYTIASADATFQEKLVSGTNIKTINNNSILGSGNLDINGLPTQTGQSGKFLTTDGTDASWADVDALPSQTGQSGKYLTTDGSSASWNDIPSDTTKANTSLSNLTSTGKNIANWSNNVTNCITEIPQDIKVEIDSNNGNIVLKSGSKVYDGTGYSWTLSSDMNRDISTLNGTYFFVIEKDGTASHFYKLSQQYSQNTQPSNAGVWFNTDTKETKWSNDGTTWGYCSLPVAIITTDGTNTSIDQVFNGFGYIGSTWFLLPNVKFSVTYKRNEDGSYKTYIINNSSIKTLTRTSGTLRDWTICASIYNYEVYDIHYEYNCYIVNNLPTSGTAYTSYFNLQDGMQYYTNRGTTPNYSSSVRVKLVENASCNSSGKITDSGKFLLPFTGVLSINDKSTISGWSMPSSRYIDLTLGASGASYTAPANGWFTISKHGADGQLAAFENITAGGVTWISSLGRETDCRVACPAKKGDNVKLWYGATGTTNFFRFIYAEGEN